MLEIRKGLTKQEEGVAAGGLMKVEEVHGPVAVRNKGLDVDGLKGEDGEEGGEEEEGEEDQEGEEENVSEFVVKKEETAGQ